MKVFFFFSVVVHFITLVAEGWLLAFNESQATDIIDLIEEDQCNGKHISSCHLACGVLAEILLCSIAFINVINW